MVWPAGKKLKNGRYTIERPLKQGRLSTTYLATSRKGETKEELVVLKVTNGQAIDPVRFDKLKAHFRDEAFQLAKCSSPDNPNHHIVGVEKSFEEEGLVCIPMEFIAGTTLAEQNPRKLSEAEALHYIRQVSSALIVLHKQGLIHRDVSPDNIMLRSRMGINEAVLIDFGLVRDWETGTTLMASDITPFTAPELCDSGEKRGELTDLYGLGAVLYTLVTGNNPLKAGKRKLNERLPDLSSIHPMIARAIEKAMEFEYDHRSPSVAEWLKMLPDIPLPVLTAVQPPSNPPARQWTVERIGLVVAILAMIFTAFQGVMAIVSYYFPKDPPAPIQSPLKPPSSVSK